MNTDQPRPIVRPQSQLTTPVAPDSTLVDDPVALVDSTTALVGGQVTSMPLMQSKAKILVPRPEVKIRR